MNRSDPRRPSAFALLSVLLLLGFVVAASVAATAVVATDARCTLSDALEVQRRQIVHAAAVECARRLDAADLVVPSRFEVALPNELVERGGRAAVGMTSAAADASHRVATIQASYGGGTFEQTIRFRRTDDRWRAVEVEIR